MRRERLLFLALPAVGRQKKPKIYLMKTKLFLSISTFCLLASVSVAQITIDSTDMPSIGDTAVMGIDTMPSSSLMVLGTGGPMTWDFTSMTVHDFDTILYVDPSTTLYGTDFPMADLAIEGATYAYQTLDSNALIGIGQAGLDPFGAGFVVSAPFVPTQVIVTLPSTNGAIFNDTSGFDQKIDAAPLGLPVPNVDSIRLVHYSTATSEFDAYGNVTTNGGTYTTIRQLYTENTVDSVFAYCSDTNGCNVIIVTLPFGWSFVPSQVTEMVLSFPNPIVDITFTYKWWAKGESVPVAEMETDAVGGNVIAAKYKLGNNVIAMPGSATSALCKDSCDGTATVLGFSGSGSYNYVWDASAGNQTTATATGLCAGTYSAYIVDGPDTSGTVSVTVGEPAIITIVISTTVITAVDSTGIATSLIQGGITPYTYLWDDPDGQTTASAINLPGGVVSLTITDANGCVMTGSATVLVGIEDLLANNHIALYPNPVTNELFIEADLEHNASFVAYNVVGKQVINVAIANKVNAINTTDLANGMYVFQLIDSKGEVIQLGKFTVDR